MTEQLTLDHAVARAEAERGMALALSHAEREVENWGQLAYLFLEQFCRQHSSFISEDVSDASIAWGLIQPPTLRAWGSIYRRAIRSGLIAQEGTGRSRRRHCSICPRWRSMIYRAQA